MIYLSIVSFFDPLLTSDGQSYHRLKYKQIIQEQVTIGYLTKGGVSYSDTDNMTPYERQLAYDTIKEILKCQQDAELKAYQKIKDTQNKDPKTLSR